jgi:hypothetical protein
MTMITKIIDIINEEIFLMKKINESLGILRLDDIAELLSRTGFAEKETIYDMVQNIFKKKGDDGVKEFYKDFTKGGGGKLDDIGRGQYVIKY